MESAWIFLEIHVESKLFYHVWDIMYDNIHFKYDIIDFESFLDLGYSIGVG